MITHTTKDALGFSFTAQFPGMKVPQEFTVYPVKAGQPLLIQSDTRIGYVYHHGRVELAGPYREGAFQPHLAFRQHVCTLTPEQMQPIEGMFK